MQIQPVSTRFRQINRGSALAVLALFVVAMLALVAGSFNGPEPVPAASLQNGDLALYGRIVDRLQQGQDYYAAAHAELVEGHYPTLSVFNWRTPLLLRLVSLAPSIIWAQGILAALAVVASGLGAWLANRQGNWIIAGASIAVMILSLGAVLVPGTVFFGEVVAGVLILGSCCCYGLRLWLPGLLLALLALFVRELAAPYVVICLGLAMAQGRWREVGLGILGLAGFGIYFLWHIHAVHAQLGAGDITDASGWISFGGLHFLVETAAFNGVLMVAPFWVSGIVLPLGLLGLLAFPAGARMALVVGVYAVAFSIIGRPFNSYWGAIYTPLLGLGVVWAPLALRDLLAAAMPIAPRLQPSNGADRL
jgi:hypothetical protein